MRVLGLNLFLREMKLDVDEKAVVGITAPLRSFHSALGSFNLKVPYVKKQEIET